MPPLLLSFLFLLLLLSTTTLSDRPAIFLPLTHTLSQTPPPSSTFHLLYSSSLRSTTRHRHRSFSLPLSPGSDYTLSLSLLSQPTTLFLDTGSDLVWLPCHPFLCILCEGKPHPSPLNLSSSSSSLLPCSHPLCSSAHSSLPSRDLCTIAGCPLDAIETSSCPSVNSCPAFYYAYADGSLTAHLRTATLPLSESLLLLNFTFGCSHSSLAESVGVAGFGRGPLSLPAQLSRIAPHLGNQFSYCLVSHSFDSDRLRRPSPLILGRTSSSPSSSSPVFVYTPMLDDPKHTYYYSVGLDGISVGGRRIEASRELKTLDADGNGGFVVDSGTTFTMLPREMFRRFSAEFDSGMLAAGFRRAPELEGQTGLGPCYHHGELRHSSIASIPRVWMHFSGNATVRLRRRSYYHNYNGDQKYEGGVGCVTMMETPMAEEAEEGGPAGTMGNVQQQGMEVVFDLEGRRVGFARKSCGRMWESLSRGNDT